MQSPTQEDIETYRDLLELENSGASIEKVNYHGEDEMEIVAQIRRVMNVVKCKHVTVPFWEQYQKWKEGQIEIKGLHDKVVEVHHITLDEWQAYQKWKDRQADKENEDPNKIQSSQEDTCKAQPASPIPCNISDCSDVLVYTDDEKYTTQDQGHAPYTDESQQGWAGQRYLLLDFNRCRGTIVHDHGWGVYSKTEQPAEGPSMEQALRAYECLRQNQPGPEITVSTQDQEEDNGCINPEGTANATHVLIDLRGEKVKIIEQDMWGEFNIFRNNKQSKEEYEEFVQWKANKHRTYKLLLNFLEETYHTLRENIFAIHGPVV
jgi:hypothetical protein